MPTQPSEAEVIRIALHHLGRVEDYNPYQNFPNVRNRFEFGKLIASDPAFESFGLDDDRYVVAKIGGNLITSLHRKIGDMYEEIFRYLLCCRFDLTLASIRFAVNVQIGGRVQERSTDGYIPITHTAGLTLPSLRTGWESTSGLAFELRSCYQIGDSKRIQADWDMALALRDTHRLTPVMLVLCNTSLRSPIDRLKHSWNLYEGAESFRFIRDLTGFDLRDFLGRHRTVLTSEIAKSLTKL